MVDKYKIRIRDLPEAEKPREKLRNLGPSALDKKSGWGQTFKIQLKDEGYIVPIL